MLTKLKLERFGKFEGKEYELSPVTVFLGKNEAGKTTICDAFLEAVCSPAGNSGAGKDLKNRYGDRRAVETSDDGRRPEMGHQEFLSLFAVKSSDISIEAGGRADWLDRVKAKLFSGGIDPSVIASDLRRASTEDARLSHIRQLNKLKQEQSSVKDKLKELNSRRDAILAAERDSRKFEADIETGECRLKELESELAKLDAEIARQEKVRRRQRLEGYLATIAKKEKAAGELAQQSAFARDESGDLDGLEKELNEKTSALRLTEAEEKRANGDLRDARNRKREHEDALKASAVKAEVGSEIRGGMERFLANPPMVTRTRWRAPFLAGSVLAIGAGVIAAGLLEPVAARVAAPLVGALVALALAFLSKQTTVGRDEKALSALLGRLVDRWRNATEEDVAFSSPEGLRESVDRAIRDREGLEEKAREAAGDEVTAQRALEGLEVKKKGFRETVEDLRRSIAGWLGERAVTSQRKYYERLKAYKNLETSFDGLKGEVQHALAEEGCEDQDALRLKCDRELRELDKEGIPSRGMPDARLNELRRKRSGVRDAKERLTGEVSRLREEFQRRQGEVKGALGDLPGQIVETERQICDCEKRIADMELERKAAGLAGRIFGEIAAESEADLGELGREVAEHFGVLAGDARAVEVPGLSDLSKMEMTDAGGERRPMDHLSAGTKDGFMFAARLVLARKASTGESILVLDDPFVRLDPSRCRGALELLKRFRDDTGWQVILLTKDERLAESACAMFGDQMAKKHMLA